MNTRETAEILNVSERTVRRHAGALGLTENGKQTMLDEKAITSIKNQIEKSGRNDLDNVVQLPNVSTDLEMLQKAQDFMVWAGVKIKEETERRITAEAKIAIDAPKVDFFDSVTSSKDAIDMKDAAKVMNIGMGRNTLFQKLRDINIFMENNTPYQTYIDRGYFRVIESKWVTPEGETSISFKTVVYQKGLDYLLKLFK